MTVPPRRRRTLPAPLLIAAAAAAATAGSAVAAAEPTTASPIRVLLEQGGGKLLYIYDGIRHVELPLGDGRAVVGLSCERREWTLFRLERGRREVYSFRDDPRWGYTPAGDIASSRLCRDPVRVAE
jgi:hypothetical protein